MSRNEFYALKAKFDELHARFMEIERKKADLRREYDRYSGATIKTLDKVAPVFYTEYQRLIDEQNDIIPEQDRLFELLKKA